ncbi:type II toxin-antitoxin system RnlA family toxin [Parageobacillus thermoglucosidasius]|uniref:type II toxin-antitoxin system RnlA family toxin n=1 Tax=Parageobacillus thermoglucosidasius TaxID=1426 RepID=UPI0001D17A81|nr:type II toxin-antitoxin system RnlA family toxin [Parageobacillus thermoglucosidasius]AEH47098.1 hypothetical protein Geoth_1102 [Parageobacillus thermoglucosidasius C56-YS93]
MEIKRDLREKVEAVLLDCGFEKKVMNNNYGHEFISPNGGKFCIYNSGKVVVQGKAAEQETLRKLWNEKCKFAEVTDEDKKQNTLVFKVSQDKLSIIKEKITDSKEEYGFSVKDEIAGPYVLYKMKIIDNYDYRVTIIQYESGKLVVQGQNSTLWNNILEIVSTSLDSVFNTSVAQVVVQSQEEVEVLSVVTSDDQKAATRSIKEKLGDCFGFLYLYDRDRIEASEFLLQSNIPVKDYSLLVSGTLRAFEGFFKKLLIEIGAFSESEISDRKWNFGKIIDEGTGDISEKVFNCFSTDSSIRLKQETVIKKMLNHMSQDRNPYSHSGPPFGGKPLRTLNQAISLHNELVDLMRVSYNIFKLGSRS